MTLQQFFDRWNGQYCEVVDLSNPNQCFDLAVAYTDALGYPRVFNFLYAHQIYTSFGPTQAQYYDKIPNTPSAVPQAGDIVVWGGSVGHVAVATGKGDTDSFESFDQNFPIGSRCHFQTHSYDNPPVLGWLRPKKGLDQQSAQAPSLSEQDKKDIESMKRLREYNGVWYEAKDIIADFEKLKEDRRAESEALNNKNDTLSKENLKLLGEIDTVKKQSELTLSAALSEQRTSLLFDCATEKKALEGDYQEKLKKAEQGIKIEYKETPLSQRFKGKSKTIKFKAITDIILA